MLKYITGIVLLFLAGHTFGQDTADSVFAVRKGTRLAVKYEVQPRETVQMLAYRFYVPESSLYAINDRETLKTLKAGSIVFIPVLPENYMTARPTLDAVNAHELYYHVVPKDDIGVLASYAGVTKDQMRSWNTLHGNTLHEGQPLYMGWVKIMAKDTLDPATEAAYPAKLKPVVEKVVDTVKVPVPGGLDTIYNRQTMNGANIITEKGTAVFFDKTGKSAIYQAFHNGTPRGTIIKVFNPGSGKTIYVKVLGKIPDTRLYTNSIIGISADAKEALGLNDSKAWCELSYSPN